MAGKRIGLSANGTISYLASDGLGSATVTLSSSGTATAAQLFVPYGALRYSSGTMPTPYGFTGQRSDAVSGLDYYGSRYYDPQAAQFTSADSVAPGGGFDLWGLSRYAYVEGNPENRTDPTGHINVYMGDDGSAVPIENAFQGTYSWGSSPVVTYHRGFTRAYPAARSRAQRWTSPRSQLPIRPHGPCPTVAGCLNAQTESSDQPKRTTAIGTCGLGGCGLALSTRGGRVGMRGLGGLLGILAVRGGTACEADEEECDQVAQQLELFPSRAYDRLRDYGRTPTAEQRDSVPPGQEFDHDPPLVKHYYEGSGDGSLPGFNLTQAEREAYARSLDAGQAATSAAQRAQGAAMAAYSKVMKQLWGLS